MSYRLLCLDAGFTLLSPRRTLAEALSGVLAQDGHQITEDEMRAAWEEADRWFWDEYHRPGNDTWTDDDRISDYWRRYHGVMLGRLGVEAHREMLDRILASQFAADAWEPYPDVEPMLREVRGLGGVAIGIVSDWGSNLRAIVAGLGLDRYLDFVLPSGAVGVAKPNPGFYRLALDEAGVRPEEALMVGDSYRADVHGAWAAGMDAVWLNRHEGMNITPDDEPLPTDVRQIRSLDELPRIVRDGGPLPRGQVAQGEPARRS
ncbi:MAG TPA: HAD-IA family hydrolase [Candidatus Limnocylindrales bacterium]|jgi:putative hydrolase of the HAD superfamily|nr:HAD-IA family hydrolase [Candidatus Limnocylindrales bacterium]